MVNIKKNTQIHEKEERKGETEGKQKAATEGKERGSVENAETYLWIHKMVSF